MGVLRANHVVNPEPCLALVHGSNKGFLVLTFTNVVL